MAIVSQGTYIEVGDASSPPSYSEIGEVNNISGPTGQRDEIDVTHLRSTGKEFQLALRDYGEVTLDCNVDVGDSAQQTLETLFSTDPPPVRSFRITLPVDSDAGHSTATTITFNARVQNHSFNLAVEAKAELSITLRVTGAATIVWGS